MSRKIDNQLPNTLDSWSQCRKGYDCEACRTHSSCLKHSVYDPHTDRYGFDGFVAYVKEEKENPVGRAAGTNLAMGRRLKILPHFKMISIVRRNQVWCDGKR